MSLWRWLGFGSKQPIDVSELERLKDLAEAAYDSMYDAVRPKDEYEDAVGYLHAAIKEAQRLGLGAEAASLKRRLDHIRAVYNSQFRGLR